MRIACLRSFWADERGMNSIEYAMLACLMALIVVAAAASGLTLSGVYAKVLYAAEALSSETWAPSPPVRP